MNKKYFSLLCVLLVVILVAGCTAPAPATPEQSGNEPEAEEAPAPAVSFAGAPIFIGQDELWGIWYPNGENVVTIGVINPTAALVPSSNASNPIQGSYLVWTPDLTRADAEEAISHNITLFRRPLAEIEELLSGAEIDANSNIVVYASDAPTWGARVVWHLRALGLNARYLDGGNGPWHDANRPTGSSARLSDQAPQHEFHAPNYNMSAFVADLPDVLESVQNPDQYVILDARSNSEFAGRRVGASSGAFGTGRIAGAVNVEWNRTLDADGMLLPEAKLKELFAEVLDGRTIITYCQGGIRASFAWMVLTYLGADVRVFDGSWIEWSYAASTAGSFAQQALALEFTEEWTDNNGPI
ncbi:MAG: rhodanese-like domain-containing protein [Oscillospiraceae bacterium]|nr:rhodanese-like domain-containing protein [Oscillospiraceae bacterium]